MIKLISEDRAHADRVTEHDGKLPGDITAACVLAYTDAGGRRQHGVFYHPLDDDLMRQLLDGARDITVRWTDPIARQRMGELFGTAVAAP